MARANATAMKGPNPPVYPLLASSASPGSDQIARSPFQDGLETAYRQRQVAISLAVHRIISGLWAQNIDPARIADSWGSIRDMVFSVLRQYFNASAADSAQFYEQSRIVAGLPYRAVSMAQLPAEELSKVADSMAMGTFFRGIKTVDEIQAANSAGKALEAGGARLALKGGRLTVVTAARSDPLAQGWERRISPSSCGFCSMLAGRGAIYRSEHSAEFQAHDHCHCIAQPVFKGQQMSHQNQELAAQWQLVTRGKSGDAAVKAWQSNWEAGNERSHDGAASAPKEDGTGNAPEQPE